MKTPGNSMLKHPIVAKLFASNPFSNRSMGKASPEKKKKMSEGHKKNCK